MRLSFILLVIFLVGIVSAASSLTDVTVNIEGCSFLFNGENVGVSTGECSTLEGSSGYFYCGENGDPWVTTEVGYGCSMGEASFVPGDNYCCPSGMYCNKTGSEEFQCVPRIENCFRQTSENECNALGCLWLDLTETCVDGTRGIGCEYYNSEDLCNEDKLGLGVTGLGTELCGDTIECADQLYTIPKSSCGCAWYEDALFEKNCQVKMITEQFLQGQDAVRFQCSKSYFLGECVDGSQTVNWTSQDQILNGSLVEVPEECLDMLGCSGGESSRYCGEPVIKLPGFSVIGLIIVILVIFTFYYSKKK